MCLKAPFQASLFLVSVPSVSPVLYSEQVRHLSDTPLQCDVTSSRVRRVTPLEKSAYLMLPFPIVLIISSCAAEYSTLKMEAAVSSETLAKIYYTTGHHTPEDSNLHSHGRETLKPHFNIILRLKLLSSFQMFSTVIFEAFIICSMRATCPPFLP